MIRLFIAAVAGAGLLCGCNTIHTKQMTDLAPVLQGCSNKFERVIASPELFRAQVLISEIVTNTFGQTILKRHGYRVGAEYFYPASTVKLCAAVAALQTVELLQPPSLATDLADVFYDVHSRHLFLLSQESESIIETDLSGTVFRTSAVPVPMTQAEGLTFSVDRSTMWVVGEPNEMRRFTVF